MNSPVESPIEPKAGDSSGLLKWIWPALAAFVVLGALVWLSVIPVAALTLPVIIIVVKWFYGLRHHAENEAAAKRALDALHRSFSTSTDPEVETIYEIMEGVEEGSTLDPIKELTDRYFLGMVGREEYYRAMRDLLER